jgi:hypothetical protein
VRVGVRPADHGRPRCAREELGELGARLARGDDHDLCGALAPEDLVELLGDAAQMSVRKLVDVTLIAGLRPATLVVPARLLFRSICGFLEAARAQAVEVPALASDHGDERALPLADDRDERGQVELVVHLHCIGNRRSQRKRPPEVVDRSAEDGKPADAVAFELRLDEASDAIQVGLQCDALVVCQLGPGELAAACLVEERVDTGLRVARGGCHARVEVQVQADGETVVGPKGCQVAKRIPAHGCGHTTPRY